MSESAVGAQAVERYLEEMLSFDEAEPGSEDHAEMEPETPQPAYYLLTAAGVRFALPRQAVRTVHTKQQELLPAAVASEHLTAAVEIDGEIAPILDLATLVLGPERVAQLPNISTRAVILLELAGLPFSIASESEQALVDIDSERVQWRGPNGQRLWLAGTCLDQKIALLDLDGLKATIDARPGR